MRICFCLAGWHFNERVYRLLSQVADAELHVVSHRPIASIPDYIYRYVDRANVYVAPNVGYDWGCYQQFLDRSEWTEYDALFLLHDDIAIHSLGFVPHALHLLRSGACVVGNGRNSLRLPWPRTHPWYYAHSQWMPPSRDFEHETVRGSFVATTPGVLQRLGHVEVFWDPFHLTVGFGNYSLFATSGKLQHLFGDDCFAFLGTDPLSSPYVTEQVRGGQGRRQPDIRARAVGKFYNRLGGWYTSQIISSRHPRAALGLAMRGTRRLLSYINGAARRGRG